MLTKDTKAAGRMKAELRLEVLNLTNSPKFLGPNGVFGSPTFGRITRQVGFPRLLQVTLRGSW